MKRVVVTKFFNSFRDTIGLTGVITIVDEKELIKLDTYPNSGYFRISPDCYEIIEIKDAI